jgi:sigma-54-specific transcriptional regulator
MSNASHRRVPPYVFEDAASRALLRSIESVAPSDATVLVTGETGTGKEIVARHVHRLSRRSSSRFVAVNCNALAESLVEAELFGHERGAFTGATTAKAGWFEAAHGGTLFLDEIGDLPPAVQIKLLRVLQEGEIVRVGSRQPIAVDVRVVAATHAHLEEAIKLGRFREDLYYRLHVAPLVLTPLRDRPRDIVPLAHSFIERFRDNEKGIVVLSESARRRLLEHAWPGNVRELENVVRYALLVCQGNTIDARDLRISRHDRPIAPARPPATGLLEGRRAAGLSDGAAPASDGTHLLENALAALFEENLAALKQRIDQAVFRAAFRYCHRNQVQTAHLLGVTRNVVRARLIEAGELAQGSPLAREIPWHEPPAAAANDDQAVPSTR